MKNTNYMPYTRNILKKNSFAKLAKTYYHFNCIIIFIFRLVESQDS